jgi:hypothetical protein
LFDPAGQGGHLHRSTYPVADLLKEVHSQFPGTASCSDNGDRRESSTRPVRQPPAAGIGDPKPFVANTSLQKTAE